MTKKSVQTALFIECLLIFGGVPLTIAVSNPRGWIYLLLWVFALMAWWVLKNRGYQFRKDWNFTALDRTVLRPMLLRFIPCALGMLIFTWLVIPDHLFSLPLHKPGMWLIVMVLYPLLSVVPQEVIFRAYFLKRYSVCLPETTLRVASALAFGWVHIVMQNWVAVVFSMIGGVFFAETYIKTKSLACACFEHSLYGCYLFTIGLGFFFYHGAVH